jgi:hypothetical protein
MFYFCFTKKCFMTNHSRDYFIRRIFFPSFYLLVCFLFPGLLYHALVLISVMISKPVESLMPFVSIRWRILLKMIRLLVSQTTLIWDLSWLEGKPYCLAGRSITLIFHEISWLAPLSHFVRIDKDKPTESANNNLFQLAASWQANKNFMLKVK